MSNWLLQLLGVPLDNPGGIVDVRLSMLWDRLWVIAPLAAVLAVVVFFTYRRSAPGVSRLRLALLATLRCVFLGLLLLLLMKPSLAFTVENAVRRTLLVLVDTSNSMKIEDARGSNDDKMRVSIAVNNADPTKGLSQPLTRPSRDLSRTAVLQAVLRNPTLNLLPQLEQKYDLRGYGFSARGDRLEPIAGFSPTRPPDADRGVPFAPSAFRFVDALGAQSPVTPAGDRLRDLLTQSRGQPLAGILVATDGANNAGSQLAAAAELARREGVPLYVYGIGITRPRDLSIANLSAPPAAFINEDIAINATVRASGMDGQSANAILRLGNKIVGSQRITFPTDGQQNVSITIKPDTKGEFDLTLTLETGDAEAAKGRVTEARKLTVIDDKIKVLYVEQYPRWEYKYLFEMLRRDERVEFKTFLFEASPAMAQGKDSPYLSELPRKKEEWLKYNVIILGDVDAASLPAGVVDGIVEFVDKKGGGLLFIAGKRSSPMAYRRTPLEKLLPVELASESTRGPDVRAGGDAVAETPFKLELTADGRRAETLRLASGGERDNADAWAKLPPIFWTATVGRKKPAAQSLLVHPDPSRATPDGKMPIIAVHGYGRGQVIYVGTDNTWRFRRNKGDQLHTRLWVQLIRRLGFSNLLNASTRTQLDSDRDAYATLEKVTVYARLYTREFNPITADTVAGRVKFRDETGQEQTLDVTLRPVPNQPGQYQGDFTARSAGSYSFGVLPTDQIDGSSVRKFEVKAIDLELADRAMNEADLRNLATASGGAFFREENLHTLVDSITAKSDRIRSTIEVELWSQWLYYLLLMLVVTAEWVVRKISQLK